MKPWSVAQVHRSICARNGCEYLDKLGYSDPFVACPNNHFGIYSRKLCSDSGKRTRPRVLDSAPSPNRSDGTRAQTWPMILLPLRLLAQEGDRGAGDIIARTIGPIGGDAFKSWYKRLFGKGCGCGARQETLNARWPLEVGRPA